LPQKSGYRFELFKGRRLDWIILSDEQRIFDEYERGVINHMICGLKSRANKTGGITGT
jgi:hypothetical protein